MGVGQHSGKYRKVWGKAAGEVRKLRGYVQETSGEGASFRRKTEGKLEMRWGYVEDKCLDRYGQCVRGKT